MPRTLWWSYERGTPVPEMAEWQSDTVKLGDGLVKNGRFVYSVFVDCDCVSLQGYLAHKQQPPPPRTTI